MFLPGTGSVHMNFKRISVQAYVDYKANEHPMSFIYKGRKYLVVEIADTWHEGGLRSPAQLDSFKVIPDDRQADILRSTVRSIHERF